mmetsp:Transcript_86699/g.280689  ORF Transcript_86699/g.280689 Transcript_86699/m.280689 type:complete len:403 (-) Transcript_86699:733-1941(-)
MLGGDIAAQLPLRVLCHLLPVPQLVLVALDFGSELHAVHLGRPVLKAAFVEALQLLPHEAVLLLQRLAELLRFVQAQGQHLRLALEGSDLILQPLDSAELEVPVLNLLRELVHDREVLIAQLLHLRVELPLRAQELPALGLCLCEGLPAPGQLPLEELDLLLLHRVQAEQQPAPVELLELGELPVGLPQQRRALSLRLPLLELQVLVLALQRLKLLLFLLKLVLRALAVALRLCALLAQLQRPLSDFITPPLQGCYLALQLLQSCALLLPVASYLCRRGRQLATLLVQASLARRSSLLGCHEARLCNGHPLLQLPLPLLEVLRLLVQGAKPCKLLCALLPGLMQGTLRGVQLLLEGGLYHQEVLHLARQRQHLTLELVNLFDAAIQLCVLLSKDARRGALHD